VKEKAEFAMALALMGLENPRELEVKSDITDRARTPQVVTAKPGGHPSQ
jgi:hypothetical protein